MRRARAVERERRNHLCPLMTYLHAWKRSTRIIPCEADISRHVRTIHCLLRDLRALKLLKSASPQKYKYDKNLQRSKLQKIKKKKKNGMTMLPGWFHFFFPTVSQIYRFIVSPHSQHACSKRRRPVMTHRAGCTRTLAVTQFTDKAAAKYPKKRTPSDKSAEVTPH